MRRAFAVGMALLLGAPALHPADCNQNRVEDAIDVETGASPDCNRNLVPDECDVLPLSYGLAFDRTVPLDRDAISLLAADIDGDGSPDLVAAHGLPEITVLWNDGAGDFAQQRRLAAPASADLMREADLEGDGDLDIAILGSGLVTFFRNDRRRRFSRLPGFQIDFPVRAMALADFDLDGDADLAAVGPFRVSVFLRPARGPVEKSQTVPIGSDPEALLSVDLDGDADPDLATGNSLGNVSILLNDGNGLYGRPRNYASGGAVRRLEAADMDGDGDADLITLFPLAAGGHAVAVLENAGEGSFEAGAPIPIVVEAVPIIPGDVDSDGDIDLLLPSSQVAFVENHDGTLGPAEVFPVELPTRLAVAADLDGDGSLDLVEAPRQGPWLAVLERAPRQNRPDCNQDGVPDDCQLDCNWNGAPDDCDVASGKSLDCNANGRPDECDSDCNSNGIPDDCDVSARASPDCNGNGIPDECDIVPQVSLEASEIDRVSSHSSLHALDLDGDGDLDLVTVIESRALRSFFNSGSGTFTARSHRALAGEREVILTGDLEGDGDQDLVLRGAGFVSVMVNDGAGSFGSGPVVDSVDTFVSAGGDLDGDGDLDLVLERSQRPVVHLFTGEAFEPAAELVADAPIRSLAMADFDRDGDLDLAGGLWERRAIRTFLNDGRARFPSSWDSSGNSDSRLTPADLDGDGDIDLVEDRIVSPALEVHFNVGGGRFASASIALEELLGAVATSDVDGDGDLDIAAGLAIQEEFGLSCYPAAALAFFVNNGRGGFTRLAGQLIARTSFPVAVAAGDLDGDGLDDAAMLVLPDCSCCGEPSTETSIHVVLSRAIVAASRDDNRNRIPDDCEGPPFRRGDSNADGLFDITDAVTVLLHLFQGGPGPTCASAADANDDALIDISDPIHLLRWLFGGGPPPPRPRAACGHDPDPPGAEGNIGCAAYEGC